MFSSPLGVTTVFAALFRATTAAKRGNTMSISHLGAKIMLVALFRATTAAKRDNTMLISHLWG